MSHYSAGAWLPAEMFGHHSLCSWSGGISLGLSNLTIALLLPPGAVIEHQLNSQQSQGQGKEQGRQEQTFLVAVGVGGETVQKKVQEEHTGQEKVLEVNTVQDEVLKVHTVQKEVLEGIHSA